MNGIHSNVAGYLHDTSGPANPILAAAIGDYWSRTNPKVDFRMALAPVVRALRDEAVE